MSTRPGAVDTYCLVAQPLPNSHSCPAQVQDGINLANATYFERCSKVIDERK